MAELLVVIHHKHIPIRKYHLLFPDKRLLEIQSHSEIRSLLQFTLHLNGAAHGIHDILGDRHSKPGALRLVNSQVVLPDKRFKDLFAEFLRHAYAGIRYIQMHPDIILTQGRLLLIQRHSNGTALRSKLDRIG